MFVEGERFNVQRVYENLTNGFVLSLGEGRLFTPDVPFEPFSIRNRLMASPPWTQSPIGSTGGTIGGNPLKSIPFWFPVSGQSVAQAERTIAANPQNAPAIFKQLQDNPSNRVIPPGLWFPMANQVTGAQSLDLYFNHMAAFAKQVQAQQGNPNSPLHVAKQIGQMENNPAHQAAGAALGLMLPAEQMAIARDQELAYELMAVRQTNLNLQQRLAMDVQTIEMTNAAIRLSNDRALPVLHAITGLSLGAEPEKWRTWWLDQLGYSSPSTPGARPTYQDYVTDAANGGYDQLSGHGKVIISLPTPVPVRDPRPSIRRPTPCLQSPSGPASRPARWSRRSTARGRSS